MSVNGPKTPFRRCESSPKPNATGETSPPPVQEDAASEWSSRGIMSNVGGYAQNMADWSSVVSDIVPEASRMWLAERYFTLCIRHRGGTSHSGHEIAQVHVDIDTRTSYASVLSAAPEQVLAWVA